MVLRERDIIPSTDTHAYTKWRKNYLHCGVIRMDIIMAALGGYQQRAGAEDMWSTSDQLEVEEDACGEGVDGSRRGRNRSNLGEDGV
jgi:hypothetical protein